jgi:hypothetical protein
MIRLNPTGYRYEPPDDHDEGYYLDVRRDKTNYGLIQPFRGSHGYLGSPNYVSKLRWANPGIHYEARFRLGIQMFRFWQRVVRDVIHQSYPARVWRLLRVKLPREIVNLIQYTPPIRLLIGPPFLP